MVHEGLDVARLNASHGTRDDQTRRLKMLREIEAKEGQSIGTLLDLRGPKIRIESFQQGKVMLDEGATFVLDTMLDKKAGTVEVVGVAYKNLPRDVSPGDTLLLNDGNIVLGVESVNPTRITTRVKVGGELSDRKGLNRQGGGISAPALSDQDRDDIKFAAEAGIDYIAVSFARSANDIEQARAIARKWGSKARILAKIERQEAVTNLAEIADAADAVMVARGDLGVELPAERVPALQKRIVRSCRALGRPVIVATQMLESMIESPVPTRAEASDVATAIYDGADAVMLSAESASGKHPVEAVTMMSRIVEQVEGDPLYRQLIDASHSAARPGDVAEAMCCAMRRVVTLLKAAAIVCYTSSGHTSLRAARERPESPVLSLTPSMSAARRLAVAWGVHSVHIADIEDVRQMTAMACEVARRERFASVGETIVAIAGMPFGAPGTTNLLRVATV
jgi:pyruvate kinase